MDFYEILRYIYVHNGNTFLFDSMSFECGTKVSIYPVMTNKLHSAMNGKTPHQITLRGNFLREDFSDIQSYIKEYAGTIISSFTVDTQMFKNMILVNAEAKIGCNDFFGEMVFVFQSTEVN